jgi:hypothetical protein
MKVTNYVISARCPQSEFRQALGETWSGHKRLRKYPVHETSTGYVFEFRVMGSGITFSVDFQEQQGMSYAYTRINRATTSQTKLFHLIPLGAKRIPSLWVYSDTIRGALAALHSRGIETEVRPSQVDL